MEEMLNCRLSEVRFKVSDYPEILLYLNINITLSCAGQVVERKKQTGDGNALHSRKVAGLTPDGVVGIFCSHNPSGRYVELTTLPPSFANCLEIWELQSPGTVRAWRGL